MLTLSIVAAWAIFLVGWGTLLAAAFRVRIAKRYRLWRYLAAAGALGWLWWMDALPSTPMFAFALAVVGLVIAGWVLVLRW
jgi:hypothetical protein